MTHATDREYKLCAVVRDIGRRQEHSEGPYWFDTVGDALDWVRKQTSVTILQVTIWHKDEIVADADMRGQ